MKLLNFFLLSTCFMTAPATLCMQWSSPFTLPALHNAIRDNNFELVQELVQKNPNQIQENDLHDMSPLLFAINNNNKKITLFLLKNGADAAGALAFAARSGYADMVQFLLENGVNVNQGDVKGNTALMVLSEHGDSLNSETPLVLKDIENIATILLQHSADINKQNSEKKTALMLSLTNSDNPEIAPFLIRNGADVTKKDSKGKTALEYALKRVIMPSLSINKQAYYIKVIQLITQHMNHDMVAHYPRKAFELLDEPLQKTVMWLKKGASTKKLSEAEIFMLIYSTFEMPHFSKEFESLLHMLKNPKDFNKIFTANVINDTLDARNVNGFKVLLPFITNNRVLLNLIRDELDTLKDQKFADEIRTIIKNETGKVPMKFSYKDVQFSHK